MKSHHLAFRSHALPIALLAATALLPLCLHAENIKVANPCNCSSFEIAQGDPDDEGMDHSDDGGCPTCPDDPGAESTDKTIKVRATPAGSVTLTCEIRTGVDKYKVNNADPSKGTVEKWLPLSDCEIQVENKEGVGLGGLQNLEGLEEDEEGRYSFTQDKVTEADAENQTAIGVALDVNDGSVILAADETREVVKVTFSVNTNVLPGNEFTVIFVAQGESYCARVRVIVDNCSSCESGDCDESGEISSEDGGLDEQMGAGSDSETGETGLSIKGRFRDPEAFDGTEFRLSATQGYSTSMDPANPKQLGAVVGKWSTSLTHSGSGATAATTIQTGTAAGTSIKSREFARVPWNGSPAIRITHTDHVAGKSMRSWYVKPAPTGGESQQRLYVREISPAEGETPAVEHITKWQRFNDVPNGFRTLVTVTEAGVVVSKIDRRYELGPYGYNVTKRIVDPDGLALTTTWEYGPSLGSPIAAGKVTKVNHPDGSWETIAYQVGSTTHTRPHGDGSLHEVTASAWNLHTNEETTTTVLQNPDGTNPTIVDKRIVKFTAIAKIDKNHSSASESLTTTTHYYFDGSLAGRIKRVNHPDGTATTYGYASPIFGGFQTIVSHGSWNGSTVNAGTTTTTERSSVGQVKSRTVTDIETGFVVDRMEASDPDARGRFRTFTHNGGAYTTSRTYTCCGGGTETDRYGIITTYTTDGLGRRTSTTRLGVTTSTQFVGLTTNTLRNNEIIATSTRNLAGDVVETSERTGTVSTLRTTIIATTYASQGGLPAGIGRRVLTTLPASTMDSAAGQVASTTMDYFIDGSLQSAGGDATAPLVHARGATAIGRTTTSHSVDDDAAVSQNTITQTDWLGRTLSVTWADNSSQTSSYDPTTGLLLATTDPDGVVTLYGYNFQGEQTIAAIDLNRNGSIDAAVDRISETATTFTEDENEKVWQLSSRKIYRPGESTAYEVARTLSRVDGLASASLRRKSDGGWHGSTSATTLSGSGAWTVSTTSEGGPDTLSTYTGGLLESQITYPAGNTTSELHKVSYTYDSLNRLKDTIDSRTGTTRLTYVSTNLDLVSGEEQLESGRTLTHTYEQRNRRNTMTDNGKLQRFTYDAKNLLIRNWGAQTSPVLYRHDPQGRMVEMTTYRGATTGFATFPTTTGDTTKWTYETVHGRLHTKTYPGVENAEITYLHTPGGRLASREWESGKTATYTYDFDLAEPPAWGVAGQLAGITYSDGVTPAVGYSYDRLGRPLEITNTLATSEFAYDPDDLAPDTETVTYQLPGQSPFTRILDRRPSDLSRDAGWELKDGATIENQVTYGYHATTGRLETVASATDTFTYGYAYDQTAADPEAEPPVPAGARVGSATGAKQDFMPYTLTRSGSPVLQTLRTYEATRDVLTTIQNNAGGTIRSSYTYNVNHLGQREDVTTSGSAFGGNPADWDWTYDDLGQVKSADSASFDRSYQYDLIGNRRRAANSLVLPTSDNYAANALNQYTLAAGVALPVPANDPDGNLLDDGGVNHTAGTARLYVWDAENRLLAVKDKTSGNTLVSHAYDASSRRVCSTASGTITYYLHDAWNVIAEYVKPASGNAALSRTRVWGLDLSGSLQGAGGVGGLLAETIATGGNAGTYYTTFDGNGNISEYLDNAGTVAAHYEYDPFGNLTVSTETLAAEFNYRFSTKPLEPISGWYYYTYRYYDPLTGRWPSRDPIAEISTVTFGNQSDTLNSNLPQAKKRTPKFSKAFHQDRQLSKKSDLDANDFKCYIFVRNDGINLVDVLGMFEWPLHWPPIGVGTPIIPPDLGPRDPGGLIDEAMEVEDNEMPSGHGAHGGGYAHCVANCNLVRRHGIAVGIAGAALWALSETDPADNRANLIGQGLAHLKGSCECLCKKAFPPK